MTAVLQKKICMLGGFSVGKTSLVKRYVQSIFSEAYLTTVGVKIDKNFKSRWKLEPGPNGEQLIKQAEPAKPPPNPKPRFL